MNYKVSAQTLIDSYKPFDIVEDAEGNVGFISEVNVNDCQPEGHQISYSVTWLKLNGSPYNAWWDHSDLTRHCNLFVKIAESTCHPAGSNAKWAKTVLSSGFQ